MKQLRLSLAMTVLTLAFTIPVFAGDMQTTVTSQPPPPATVETWDRQTTVTATDNTANEATATDLIREVTLNLMRSVLFLF